MNLKPNTVNLSYGFHYQEKDSLKSLTKKTDSIQKTNITVGEFIVPKMNLKK